MGAKGLAKEAWVSDLVSVANEEIEFYTETGEYSILIRTWKSPILHYITNPQFWKKKTEFCGAFENRTCLVFGSPLYYLRSSEPIEITSTYVYVDNAKMDKWPVIDG